MTQDGTASVQTHEFSVFAEGFQFYVQDSSAESDVSDVWDEETREVMLAVGDGILGVGTVRDFDVEVEVEIRKDKPADDFFDADHVVECGLDITSGKLLVSGPAEYRHEAKTIALENGYYAVRVYYTKLDEVDEDGFEGDDKYKIVLWRSSDQKAKKVLKAWMPKNLFHGSDAE